jgi:hypothetical protein
VEAEVACSAVGLAKAWSVVVQEEACLVVEQEVGVLLLACSFVTSNFSSVLEEGVRLVVVEHPY